MTTMRFADAGAVRAMMEGEKRVLEVLAVPFGGPNRRDRLDQWFSARTDIMLSVGERRPVLYMHGYSPQKRKMDKPPILGMATMTATDERGHWMRLELNDGELATRSWEAAKAGNGRASTGSIEHLVRPQPVNGRYPPGEVEVWPVAELSIFDAGANRVPVSDDAVVLPLRAIFDELALDLPEAFEAGEAEGATEGQGKLPIRSLGGFTMDPEMQKAIDAAAVKALADQQAAAAAKEAEKAAMRTSILEELKAQPEARRAVFNVPKETKAGGAQPFRITKKDEELGITLEDKKETHEFYWNLRHGLDGTGKRPAMRVATALEETEADEALPMVPQDALNRIWEKRDNVSIARMAGITVLPTERLIFNIPREVTPMTAMAAIAENAAYVINAVEFGLLAVTVQKRGTMLSATEEVLEDQVLFQSWIERAVGRAIGLGENIDLYAAVDDKAGVQTTAGAPTDLQILTGYFALGQAYRDGSVIIANDTTWAYLRSLLIATPRAYGDFNFVSGEFETFMGKRIFADLNWPTLAAAGANVEYMSFINCTEALALVERRGLKMLVDPYTLAGTGEIKYYPSVRYAIAMVNTDAVSNLSDT